ncbi:hypothetical protein K3172_14155 [Qipengyuania sp. 6B39]|uniref:hypothetical protein n=1 Tax=Qipengyuania proteolytica TaxID=2867239 RepID=UPI001C88EECF|nr:hypothetical protein [Qipengyuania proteolytica]MBX7497001.1 hypothetical protein [Qipengyuania proteolytica]
MLRFTIQVILILVVFAGALRAGGRPEKAIASIYLAMMLLNVAQAILLGRWSDDTYGGVQLFHFALDLAALAGVVCVILLYHRWWTIWVGSAQLVAVGAHLVKFAAVPLNPFVYSIMERWPVWVAIVLTGLGTLLHWRRERRGGAI